MKDDSDGDKKQEINHIQNLYGFNLFCQKRFDDSMQVFAKLGTGMAQPGLLPWWWAPVFWRELGICLELAPRLF